MRIVNHETVTALAHEVEVERAQERRGVAPYHIRSVADRADVIEIDPAEVFAEEQVLDLALSVLADVLALLVEELDIHRTWIERREPHMNAAHRIGRADIVAGYGKRHSFQVGHVDASGRQTGDNRALDHAWGFVRVAVDADDRAFG